MTDLIESNVRLRLAGLRGELIRARGHLLDAAFYSAASAGPPDAPADRADGPTVAERQAESVLDELQRRTLAQINAALDRFDDGTYGTCVSCGDPIPDERLEVMPTASRCLPCQHRQELGRAHG
jgi:DnaK suppressor protein